MGGNYEKYEGAIADMTHLRALMRARQRVRPLRTKYRRCPWLNMDESHRDQRIEIVYRASSVAPARSPGVVAQGECRLPLDSLQRSV